MQITQRLRWGMSGALALGVATMGLTFMAPQEAEAANATRAGYNLPNGHASRWIGSYTASGKWALCGDADLSFSSATKYSSVKTTKKWKDSIRNEVVTTKDAARVSWLMNEYKSKSSDKNVNAALDATAYAILHKGKYAYGKSKFNDRVNATGHGSAITKLSRTMIDESAKYAGKPTIKIDSVSGVNPGKSFDVRVEVKAEGGAAYPGRKIKFSYAGQTKTGTTNSNGAVRVSFTSVNKNARVVAEADGFADTAIHYMSPDNPAMQRLIVAPTTFQVEDSEVVDVVMPTVALTTDTQKSVLLGAGGADLRDNIVVSRAGSDYAVTATARLYGPFATPPNASSCTPDKLVGSGTAAVRGNGRFTSTPVNVDTKGYYTWIASLPGFGSYNPIAHGCGLPNETVYVGWERSTPTIDTTASHGTGTVGVELSDNVRIEDIKLPCVDATGVPVGNPDGLNCDDLILEAAVPAVPDTTATWVSDADGAGTPGCYEDATDPSLGTSLFYNGTDQIVPAALTGQPQAAVKAHWATTGTQADCEAVVTKPGKAGTPAVTAETLPDFELEATAELYGPYNSLDEATCETTPVGSVKFDVMGNGTYVTPTIKPEAVGVYTWVITVPDTDYVEGVRTECGIPAETTTLKAEPKVRTLTSSFEVAPNSTLFDTVWVEDAAGAYSQDVVAELYGPYDSRDTMTCAPEDLFASITFPVAGNGEYRTPDVQLGSDAGYYTWVERFAEDGLNVAVNTECGIADETSLVKSQPKLKTKTSDKVVEVNDTIFDTLIVDGIVGDFEETAVANLYGPFASRDDITCANEPYKSVRVTVDGNGEFETPEVKVKEPGYYTWHESFAGNELNQPFTHDCGLTSETSLVKAPKKPPVKIESGVSDEEINKILNWFA